MAKEVLKTLRGDVGRDGGLFRVNSLANGRRGVAEELTNGMPRRACTTTPGLGEGRGVGAESTVLVVEKAGLAVETRESSIRK